MKHYTLWVFNSRKFTFKSHSITSEVKDISSTLNILAQYSFIWPIALRREVEDAVDFTEIFQPFANANFDGEIEEAVKVFYDMLGSLSPESMVPTFQLRKIVKSAQTPDVETQVESLIDTFRKVEEAFWREQAIKSL